MPDPSPSNADSLKFQIPTSYSSLQTTDRRTQHCNVSATVSTVGCKPSMLLRVRCWCLTLS